MKRSIALVISAAVTAFILVVVLAVASPKTELPAAGAGIDAPQVLSNDPAALQQQIQDAYALLQQRESEYQQRLQEAYTQLQTQSQAAGGFDDDDHEREDSRDGAEAEFAGRAEAIDD